MTDHYTTLINPGQPIPYYIQAMTGITDKMVTDAPRFEQVAEKVYSLLKDRIFIAHNVNFDYSFVKAHLQVSGYDLNTKKLCTVRLSRKIFPGFHSYSLGKLCTSLGITINDRHRASGDSAATVKVFQLLLQNDKEQHIAKSLQRNSKESILPPNVPKTDFEQLPYTPGVYFFTMKKGKWSMWAKRIISVTGSTAISVIIHKADRNNISCIMCTGSVIRTAAQS